MKNLYEEFDDSRFRFRSMLVLTDLCCSLTTSFLAKSYFVQSRFSPFILLSSGVCCISALLTADPRGYSRDLLHCGEHGLVLEMNVWWARSPGIRWTFWESSNAPLMLQSAPRDSAFFPANRRNGINFRWTPETISPDDI